MSSRIAVVLAVAAAVMVAVAARPSEEHAKSDADSDALRFPTHPGSSTTPSAYRHRRGRRHRPHGPAGPTPPSPPPPPPAPMPPLPPAPACDCRRCFNSSDDSHIEPDPPFRQPQPGGVGGGRSSGGSSTGTGTGWGSRRGPWFGRSPFPGAAPPPPAAGTGTDCVAPLAELMPCGAFVTGSEPATPTPQSDCCTGLGGFLNTSTSAAAGYGNGGDRILRCLCPVILGDVNKMLPKPTDPVRLMYLPIACGIVLPPQVLYICFTGQQTLPPLLDVSSDSDNNSTSTP